MGVGGGLSCLFARNQTPSDIASGNEQIHERDNETNEK
jgi:hypothetical protein